MKLPVRKRRRRHRHGGVWPAAGEEYQLANIRVPVALVWGSKDDMVDVDTLQRQLPCVVSK